MKLLNRIIETINTSAAAWDSNLFIYEEIEEGTLGGSTFETKGSYVAGGAYVILTGGVDNVKIEIIYTHNQGYQVTTHIGLSPTSKTETFMPYDYKELISFVERMLS